MGNCLVLGEFDGWCGCTDHMVVGFNKLAVGLLFLYETFDGSQTFIVEDATKLACILLSLICSKCSQMLLQIMHDIDLSLFGATYH